MGDYLYNNMKAEMARSKIKQNDIAKSISRALLHFTGQIVKLSLVYGYLHRKDE